MMVKCETMEETTSTPQAPESNQAVVLDDSSAKTIEFLRARLLSERAASKAARQQAQEIAGKVKDLNVRLEMEMKSRTEAESAMEKVVAILKAKGLAVDVNTPASTDLKDQLERGISALDDIKEVNKDRQDFSTCTMDPSIDKEVSPKPVENKDVSAEMGMIEEKNHGTREPSVRDLENGIDIVSKADQTLELCCDIQEGLPQNAAADHHHGHVQLVVTDKLMVHTDNISSNGASNVKEDSHASQAFDQGSSITLKLKAMLHQMEEEMAALPKEQPLRLQLQSWVDHVAGVLGTENERGLDGDLEMHRHSLDCSSMTGANYPLQAATVRKTKNFAHTQEPNLLNKQENVDCFNQNHYIPEGVGPKEEWGKTLSVVPKDISQRTNMVPPLTNYDRQFHSMRYPPACKDPSLPAGMFHTRRPSHDDALQFLQQPPHVPGHPQVMQYGISQPNVAHAPPYANSYTTNGHITGREAPCYIEAPSPRSSDAFSVGDGPMKVGYGHGQWYETRSQGRGLGYREDALKCRSDMWSQAGLGSKEIHSSPYIVDASNKVHMKQNQYLNPLNVQLERGYAHSHSTNMDHQKNAAEIYMARPLNRFPLNDATLSLTDERYGILGDVLMVLDAARQHVNDERSVYAEEQLFGPPTPKVEEARRNRGHQYRDDMQRVPCEQLNYTQRSWPCSQTPIIQYPPSPASEHGYSPFERHGRHRRSSSVSTNFMMSGWDSYAQPRGEVQLGNGITLYTD